MEQPAPSQDDPSERFAPLVPLPRARFVVPALPADRTVFVGRERERDALLALLGQPGGRLVVVTGPGGIGKTRLALAVARAAAENHETAVAYVPLASITDPDFTLPAVARELGIAERAGEPIDRVIADAIGDAPLLLVLDNFERLTAAGPALNRILERCTELRILVTSRIRLHLTGEQVFPLAPLEVPRAGETALDALGRNPAVALFVNTARRSRPDFSLTTQVAPAVVHISRTLEGWPLALELAAARTSSLSPGALAERLSPRLPLLTSHAADAEPRLSSLRATIAWSANLLSEAERTCFQRLSVFHDGATLDAIEAISGREDGSPPVIDLLASLVDQSLLRIDDLLGAEPRYRMLDTIREYALELFERDPSTTEIKDRHAQWYLEVAREGNLNLKSPDAPRWLTRFGAERENLRAALAWLEQTGRRDDLLEMASRIAEYWDYQGELAEGRRWVERALAEAGDNAEPSIALARAYTWFGWFAHRQGQPSLAREPLIQALGHWRACGDREGEAYAHSVLGLVEQIEGNQRAARSHVETAHALFTSIEDRPGMIESELNLSDLDYFAGALDQAGSHAAHAHERAVAWDIKPHQAVAAVAVSQAQLAMGAVDSALAAGLEALEIAHELGFRVCVADALVSIAAVAGTRGDDETAAMLLGAGYGQLVATGSTRFFYQYQFERALQRVRARYGEGRFDRAFQRGAALELNLAIALARQSAVAPTATAVRPGLTPRERDVLVRLAAGKSDKEIAAELGLSPRTINALVARILAKLEASSRTAAAAIAIREGLV